MLRWVARSCGIAADVHVYGEKVLVRFLNTPDSQMIEVRGISMTDVRVTTFE
jgi:hypothetical protein